MSWMNARCTWARARVIRHTDVVLLFSPCCLDSTRPLAKVAALMTVFESGLSLSCCHLTRRPPSGSVQRAPAANEAFRWQFDQQQRAHASNTRHETLGIRERKTRKRKKRAVDAAEM